MEETTNLKILMAHKIPFTVRLEAVSVDQKAFMGTPIGLPFQGFQGQTVVWTMGVKLVQCLHSVHKAGLCHRDVRPKNVDPVRHHTCDAHVTSEESCQKESVQSKSPKTGSNRIFF
jgi:hypothetical protein